MTSHATRALLLDLIREGADVHALADVVARRLPRGLLYPRAARERSLQRIISGGSRPRQRSAGAAREAPEPLEATLERALAALRSKKGDSRQAKTARSALQAAMGRYLNVTDREDRKDAADNTAAADKRVKVSKSRGRKIRHAQQARIDVPRMMHPSLQNDPNTVSVAVQLWVSHTLPDGPQGPHRRDGDVAWVKHTLFYLVVPKKVWASAHLESNELYYEDDFTHGPYVENDNPLFSQKDTLTKQLLDTWLTITQSGSTRVGRNGEHRGDTRAYAAMSVEVLDVPQEHEDAEDESHVFGGADVNTRYTPMPLSELLAALKPLSRGGVRAAIAPVDKEIPPLLPQVEKRGRRCALRIIASNYGLDYWARQNGIATHDGSRSGELGDVSSEAAVAAYFHRIRWEREHGRITRGRSANDEGFTLFRTPRELLLHEGLNGCIVRSDDGFVLPPFDATVDFGVSPREFQQWFIDRNVPLRIADADGNPNEKYSVRPRVVVCGGTYALLSDGHLQPVTSMRRSITADAAARAASAAAAEDGPDVSERLSAGYYIAPLTCPAYIDSLAVLGSARFPWGAGQHDHVSYVQVTGNLDLSAIQECLVNSGVQVERESSEGKLVRLRAHVTLTPHQHAAAVATYTAERAAARAARRAALGVKAATGCVESAATLEARAAGTTKRTRDEACGCVESNCPHARAAEELLQLDTEAQEDAALRADAEARVARASDDPLGGAMKRAQKLAARKHSVVTPLPELAAAPPPSDHRLQRVLTMSALPVPPHELAPDIRSFDEWATFFPQRRNVRACGVDARNLSVYRGEWTGEQGACTGALHAMLNCLPGPIAARLPEYDARRHEGGMLKQHDIKYSYTAQSLGILADGWLGVYSCFDGFRAYEGLDDPHAIYAVKLKEGCNLPSTRGIDWLMLSKDGMLTSYKQLQALRAHVPSFTDDWVIHAVYSPSRLEPSDGLRNAILEAINTTYTTDARRSHKLAKACVNIIIGELGRVRNNSERVTSFPTRRAAEEAYFRVCRSEQRVTERLFDDARAYNERISSEDVRPFVRTTMTDGVVELHELHVSRTRLMREGFRPFYFHVLASQRLALWERCREILAADPDTIIAAIKTDAIYTWTPHGSTCSFPDTLDKDAQLPGTWIVKTVVEGTDEDEISLPHCPPPTAELRHCDLPDAEPYAKQVVVPCPDDSDAEWFYEQYTKGNTLTLSTGPGGGKSYQTGRFARLFCERLGLPSSAAIFCYPTNDQEQAAAAQGLRSMTLCNLLGLLPDEGFGVKLKATPAAVDLTGVRVIVIDECFQFDVATIAHLFRFMDAHPQIRFHCAGDSEQLGPVSRLRPELQHGEARARYLEHVWAERFRTRIELGTPHRLIPEDRERQPILKAIIFRDGSRTLADGRVTTRMRSETVDAILEGWMKPCKSFEDLFRLGGDRGADGVVVQTYFRSTAEYASSQLRRLHVEWLRAKGELAWPSLAYDVPRPREVLRATHSEVAWRGIGIHSNKRYLVEAVRYSRADEQPQQEQQKKKRRGAPRDGDLRFDLDYRGVKLVGVTLSFLRQHFMFPYAQTSHGLQGQTVVLPMVLFDTHFQRDPTFWNTALGRVTRLSNLYYADIKIPRTFNRGVHEQQRMQEVISGYVAQDIKARRKFTLQSYVTAERWQELMLEQNGICAHCEREVDVLARPRSDGTPAAHLATLDRLIESVAHTLTNVCVSCIRCNNGRRKLPTAAGAEPQPARSTVRAPLVRISQSGASSFDVDALLAELDGMEC